MNRTTSALRDPLDRLADEIHAVIEQRTAEQQLAFAEVLGMIENLKREIATIDGEHVPGRFGRAGARSWPEP